MPIQGLHFEQAQIPLQEQVQKQLAKTNLGNSIFLTAILEEVGQHAVQIAQSYSRFKPIATDPAFLKNVTRYVIEGVTPELWKVRNENKKTDDYEDAIIHTVSVRVPNLVNDFLSGKPSVLSEIHARETPEWNRSREQIIGLLKIHDNQTKAFDMPKQRVQEATVHPLKFEDMSEIRQLYTRFLLTSQQMLLLASGQRKEFQSSVNKGLFLQPFEHFEEERITDLLDVTSWHQNAKTRSKRFYKETINGTVIRDKKTQEMLAVGIHTFPPLKPKNDSRFQRETEELLSKGISGGELLYEHATKNADKLRREDFETLMRAGKVPMLFYIQGTVRYAAARAMTIEMQQALALRKKFKMQWPLFRSYYMHSIHLRRGAGGDLLPNLDNAGMNTASRLFLNQRGYKTLCREIITDETTYRIFRLILELDLEDIFAFPCWEHITADPEIIFEESHKKMPA